MIKALLQNRRGHQGRAVIFGWLIALIVSACSGSVGASQFVEAEHQDPPDSPPHVHLDDGSTVIQGCRPDGEVVE